MNRLALGSGSRPGFTLLEAVLALAILSSVMVVCLGMRAQGIAGAQRLSQRQETDREVEAIFQMLTAGLLPPAVVDRESHARTWSGGHLGHSYTLVATRVERANPVAREKAGAALAERIALFRYELTYRGRTAEFFWHR